MQLVRFHFYFRDYISNPVQKKIAEIFYVRASYPSFLLFFGGDLFRRLGCVGVEFLDETNFIYIFVM